MEVAGTETEGSGSDRGARVIAIANQKGGVGKSTTAVSLGAALAEHGYRVLVVDLDPQGNASTGLGIRPEARSVSVYEVLAAEAPVEGAIVPTQVAGLDAIPSTIDLAGAEIELVSQFSRELRLRRALEPLRDGNYDFIFLDCPPSLGLLTINALAAAEELIVPIQCEYYALEGLGQLLRNVRLVQQNVNPRLKLTGIVMTMFDPRTKLSEQVVEEVQRFFGDRVYSVVIPRTVRLSEAPGFGQPITVYDPRSKGAESYRALAREVAARPPPAEPVPLIEELPRVILTPPDGREDGRAPGPAADAGRSGAGQVSGAGDALEGGARGPGQEAETAGVVAAGGSTGSGSARAPGPSEVEGGAGGAAGPGAAGQAAAASDVSEVEPERPEVAGAEAREEVPEAAGAEAREEVPEAARQGAVPGGTAVPAGPGAPRGERGREPEAAAEAADRPAAGGGTGRIEPADVAADPRRAGPRVVVIDEDAVFPGEEGPAGPGVPEPEPRGSLAEVGDTLPSEEPRKRRWRLFRRGRDG